MYKGKDFIIAIRGIDVKFMLIKGNSIVNKDPTNYRAFGRGDDWSYHCLYHDKIYDPSVPDIASEICVVLERTDNFSDMEPVEFLTRMGFI